MFEHKRNFNYYQLEFAKDIDDDEEEEGNHFEINVFVIFLCFILITGKVTIIKNLRNNNKNYLKV